MSPRRTLKNCGSSSSCVALSQRPIGVNSAFVACDELLAEMRAEPPLGAAPQRPELEHREDAPSAADALAAVEDGRPARHDDGERDDQRDRERDDEEERREHDVERAERGVAWASRRLEGELPVSRERACPRVLSSPALADRTGSGPRSCSCWPAAVVRRLECVQTLGSGKRVAAEDRRSVPSPPCTRTIPMLLAHL